MLMNICLKLTLGKELFSLCWKIYTALGSEERVVHTYVEGYAHNGNPKKELYSLCWRIYTSRWSEETFVWQRINMYRWCEERVVYMPKFTCQDHITKEWQICWRIQIMWSEKTLYIYIERSSQIKKGLVQVKIIKQSKILIWFLAHIPWEFEGFC